MTARHVVRSASIYHRPLDVRRGNHPYRIQSFINRQFLRHESDNTKEKTHRHENGHAPMTVNKETAVSEDIKSWQEVYDDALSNKDSPPVHRTTKFDKYCLVWTKRYKTIEEVPNMVTHNCIVRARDYMRIRVSLMIMIGSVIVCMAGVIWGKYDKAKGRTATMMADEMREKSLKKYFPDEKKNS